MAPPRVCRNCGSATFFEGYSLPQVQREISLRERFVDHRFDHVPETAERMDLTDFMHGGPGRLWICARCGLGLREEAGVAQYQTDVYDRDLLQHLYPRYRLAFLAKESLYRPLLDPGAEVLELGSHTGAFLETAERWGWRPTGLDVGAYTHAFARQRGLRVLKSTLEDARLPRHAADALFLWNCFEQLEDPGATLRAAHDVLLPHGLLVVRTPNLDYYGKARQEAARGSRHSLRSLAYHNLLGFPYLTGYTPATLRAMLARHGFEPIGGVDAGLLTAPYPDLTPRLRREMRETEPPRPDALSVPSLGPWIELVARRRERESAAQPRASAGRCWLGS